MRRGLIACALGALLVAGCGSTSDDDRDDDALDDAPAAPGLGDAGDGDGDGVDGGGLATDDDLADADDLDDLPADPDDLSAVDDAPRDGTLTGRVVEALDEVPLAGVTVELRRFDDGRVVDTATSDALGEFGFADLARRDAYRLELGIDGYRDERVRSVRLPDEGEATLEPVRLVSDDNAGDGGLAGTILDATTGEPVGGLTLTFRRGIEARTGEGVASATTDAAGGYAVSGLDYGNLTCEIAGPGFQTLYTTVTVLGGIVADEQNAAVSPRAPEGETRVVLTWGASPSDLDAHLTGPSPDGGGPFHVFWRARSGPGVELDVDDTRSFGPETITVEELEGDAPYRYSVQNFSGGGADVLSRSEATVRVERDGDVVAEFFVPRGEGDLWTVFDVVGGEIVPVDTIGDADTEADYFAPALRPDAAPKLAVSPPPKT